MMSTGNRIFILRHGESEANVAERIVSSPDEGVTSWGLTDRGRQQATEASKKLKDICECDFTTKLVLISSDFKRARETAQTIHQCLCPLTPLITDVRLRERNFGSLNGTHSSNYQKVWDEDATNLHHTSYGCESVFSVFERTSKLVSEIERQFEGKIVVLVSHGDTSQITITGYRGLSPQEHRSLPHLGNCDFVELSRDL